MGRFKDIFNDIYGDIGPTDPTEADIERMHMRSCLFDLGQVREDIAYALDREKFYAEPITRQTLERIDAELNQIVKTYS